MRKKLISILIIAVMVVSVLPQFTLAASYTWPEVTTTLGMPFRPEDNYVSEQNPPNFTWQYVADAKNYELEVYSDSKLGSLVYTKADIVNNYFNMPNTLTAGNYYWWRVRYIHKNGSSGEWSQLRKFRIDPDAYEFTAPDIDTLIDRIPKSHPRILTTPDTLQEFRELKNKSEASNNTYNKFINTANGYVNRYNAGTLSLSEPAYKNDEQYRTEATALATYARTSGFAYLLSDDTNPNKAMYAKIAKEAMLAALSISFKIKANGSAVYDSTNPASYANQDQIFREMTYRCAMAYDWIYETLTQEEKEDALFFIKERVEVMSSLLSGLKSSPYDSHGWTCFGFLGITAMAVVGEIPEAEDWLKTIIPAYTALLPPWGYQDGGWSQGTDYWQYSTMTNQEFMDVLALGGVIDLYKQAWAQNEYLWTLYAYPYGSYGSFGDGSNRTKATAGYTVNSLINGAYFNNNGVAKWLVESFGNKISTGDIESYYAASLENIETESPENYPLGHQFKDIGWAVMTDSLEDENRIQMTFKSSYYGSYNHSHPDQNAFIIQAYGENLANKSGYYDSYHTQHDSTITRPSFAHNTITVDGGKGQLDDSIDAKGQLTQFVTQMDFDSVTGDATAAYRYVSTDSIPQNNLTPDTVKGNLDKFVRNIIYIRPGVFVVIDDLKAYNSASGGKSSFEWWLNAEHAIDYTNNSAHIAEGIARLDANVVYPQNTTATYYDGFYSPVDNQHYPASGSYSTKNEQRRVKFATDKVSQTKMVVTMSVYKETEEAMPVDTYYAPDGSYLRLTFGDGTVCVVNLGEDNTQITDGPFTFKGDALTYNSDSFILTNGTLVKYQKAVGTRALTLVESVRMLTIAIGHNQIAFDVVGVGDDIDKDTKSLILHNGNDFINVNSEEDLADLKGRSPSKQTGYVDARVTSSKITLYPDEGSYMLFAGGSGVSVKDMVPKNVRLVRKDDSTINVTWDRKSAYDYDIIINGTIYENVSSPYAIDLDDDTVYNVAVRAKSGDVVSDWSSYVYMSPFMKNTYSFVKYTKLSDGIKATLFAPNPGSEDLKINMAVYNKDNTFLGMYPLKAENGMYTASVQAPSDSKAKVFIMENDQLRPGAPAAILDSNNLNLKCLAVDGVQIKEYSPNIDEYTVPITAGNINMPAITAQAEDNATKVTVHHDYPNMCSYVNIVAQDKTERLITIKYEYNYEDIHVVVSADKEDDFGEDSGTSLVNGVPRGKTSKNPVGTLTWDIVKVNSSLGTETTLASKSTPINIYTNMAPHLSDGTAGSRLASDRKPNSGNLTEYINPPKEYQGFDYIVFPNTAYYSLGNDYSGAVGYEGASVHNAKATFNLSQNAEVIVIATGRNDNLLSQGFTKEAIAASSGGRYMNAVGIEDVYYNVYLLGKSANDVDSNRIPKSYEIAQDWVNVSAISGNSTLQDYIEGGYKKSSFTVNGTCLSYANTSMYAFNYVYKKVFDDVADTKEVVIDFGDYNAGADRVVVVVRPVTPRKPIDNFVYNGALSFNDLTQEQKGTDTATTHTSLTEYTKLPVTREFKVGELAYIDNSSYKITEIDSMLGLEGAYFIPPHSKVSSTSSSNSWIRAYYYGLGNCGGYAYPEFDKTPQPMYEFDLNTDSTLYILTYGDRPAFIDDSWQHIQLSKSAFTVDGVSNKFTDMYIKHIDVEDGTPVRVSALTPGNGSTSAGIYFMLVKPDER